MTHLVCSWTHTLSDLHLTAAAAAAVTAAATAAVGSCVSSSTTAFPTSHLTWWMLRGDCCSSPVIASKGWLGCDVLLGCQGLSGTLSELVGQGHCQNVRDCHGTVSAMHVEVGQRLPVWGPVEAQPHHGHPRCMWDWPVQRLSGLGGKFLTTAVGTAGKACAVEAYASNTLGAGSVPNAPVTHLALLLFGKATWCCAGCC
jgi:hypothetical protein